MGQRIYEYHPGKNLWLIRERGISFEQVIALIEAGRLLRTLEHPNPERYPGQRLYEVDAGDYIYVVAVEERGSTLFLKTVYPSRKATKRHRKGEQKS